MAQLYPVSSGVIRKHLILSFVILSSLRLFSQPVISSFAPASGPVGTTVIINGNNFSATPASNIVFFGAVKATVTAATSVSLTVTVPVGATYQPITVTTGNLTGFSQQPFVVTFTGGAGVFTANSLAPRINTTPILSDYAYKSVAADLDGDGKADVVEVNYGLGSISVFRNTGSAGTITLAAKQDFTTSPNPVSVTTGDVNGDGKQDIVVTNNGATPGVSVFINTSTAGAISFATRTDYASGGTAYSTPGGIAIRDLDGDGLSDLAIANTNGALAVYRNTSTATVLSFGTIKSFTIPNNGEERLSVADMDGDGKPDLVVSNGNFGTVSVLRNTCTAGNISFDPKIDYTAGGNPFGVETGDLDNDGKPDMVVVNGSSNTVSIFKNTSVPGTLSFAAKADVAVGSTPTAVAISDLDGDGKPDLAVTNGAGNSVYLLRNTGSAGTPAFAPPAGYATGTYPYGVFLGDLDGDGLPDILVANRDNNNISIIRNTVRAPAVFSFNPAYAGSATSVTISGIHFTGATAVTLGGTAAASFTVNTDSTITAIVGAGATGAIAVATPNGTATLAGFTYTTLPIVRSFTPKRGGPGTTVTIIGNNFTTATDVRFNGIAAASFTVNADTSITAVAGALPPGLDSVKVTNATGLGYSGWFYGGPYITAVSPSFGAIGSTVTISGNNFSTTAANNTVYFGGVKATVSAATINSLTVTVPPGAAYKPIAVTANNLTALSPQPFIVTFGPGGTPFATGSFAAKTDLSTGSYATSAVSGDIDGDGKPDIIEVNGNDNTVSVFRNTGFGSGIAFAARVSFATGESPFSVAVGDINGDGKPDIIVTNVSGSASSVSVLKNTSTPGSVSFAAKIDLATGNSIGSYPQSVSIIDLDGDGMPDLAAVNSDGTLSLFRNRSTVSSVYFDYRLNYALGAGPQSVAVADLDGDGLPDIAVAVPALNAISLFKNTSVPGSISFTAAASVPTGNGPYGVAIGDLDGDGKPDLAVANANYTFDGINYVYNVSVIKNTSAGGNISFAPKTDYNVVNYPSAIAISDLDGDGKPDLVISNRDGSAIGNNVSLLRNTGSGGLMSFAAKADYATAVNPQSVAAADLDGDGKPDIITANSTSNSISILRNQMASSPPPVAKMTGFTPASAGAGATVTISGTHLTGASSVRFGGTAAASFTIVSDSVVTAIVGTGASGQVFIATPAGADSLPGFTFIQPAPPVTKMTGFTPASAGAGATVTISGTHLTGASSVRFGGTAAASFTIVSDSVVTAIVGTGASGQVFITTPAGADSLPGFTFIQPAPPVTKITGFAPASAGAGATVTISGTHFTGAGSVRFGGTAAASFTIVSDSVVTAIVGTGASGQVFITTSAGADSLPGFTFIQPAPPVTKITGFAPASGGAGATITISGTHFTGASSVRFGGTAAASFTIVSDSVVTAIVGTGASGRVFITTPAGADSLPGFTFIQPAPPVTKITGFAPASGGAGATITISGTHFTGASSVRFGGTAAASFTVVSDSVVTAIVDTGASGQVFITTPAGTDSLPGFTFIAPVLQSSAARSIVAYPNPTTSVVTIKHPASAGTAKIELVNMPGTVIKVINVVPNTSSTKIDVAGLQSGIYTVVWSSGSSHFSQAILVP